MNVCQSYLGLDVDSISLVYDEAQDNLSQMNVGAPRLQCQLVHTVEPQLSGLIETGRLRKSKILDFKN